MKTIRSITKVFAPSFAVLLVWAQSAYALTGGTGIDVLNGEINLQTPVLASSGGTGTGTPTDDSVLVGNASSGWTVTTIPDCDDTSQNDALQYTSSNGGFSCRQIAATGGGVNGKIAFASNTKIDDSDSFVYIGANGVVTATEAEAQVPFAAATFENIYCYISSDDSVTVKLGKGTCGDSFTYAHSVSISSSQTGSNTTGSTSLTAGQCLSMRVNSALLSGSVFLSCTMERTA